MKSKSTCENTPITAQIRHTYVLFEPFLSCFHQIHTKRQCNSYLKKDLQIGQVGSTFLEKQPHWSRSRNQIGKPRYY
jgi:hypothetical protein